MVTPGHHYLDAENFDKNENDGGDESKNMVAGDPHFALLRDVRMTEMKDVRVLVVSMKRTARYRPSVDSICKNTRTAL
jgi:hypothetical protein